MWKTDVKLLCNKHLAGEHVEMHMFVGSMRKGISVQGYASTGLVEVEHIYLRHEMLATEMIERGMNHGSPLEPFDHIVPYGYVDVFHNYGELIRRCTKCRNNISRALVRHPEFYVGTLKHWEIDFLLNFTMQLEKWE